MEPQPAEVSAELVARAKASGAGVVILPVRVMGDEAVYPEAAVTVVKELRSIGVDATYLDPPERRVFEVKKSGLETAIATLVLGVASNAAWACARALISKTRTQRMTVTYVDLETSDADVRAWRVEGAADDVLQAIDRLRQCD